MPGLGTRGKGWGGVRSWPFVVALIASLRAAPGATLALALVSIFFAIVPLTLYVVTSVFAGEVAANPATVDLHIWLPVIGGLVFLIQFSAPILYQLNAALGRLVDGWAQRQVMRAAFAPDTVEHLETPTFRDAASFARGWESSSFPPGAAVNSMLEIFRALLVAAGSAILLAGFAWWMPFVLAAGFILMTIWGTRVRESGEQTEAQTAAARRRADYLREQGFDASTGREMRVFGLGAWFNGRAHGAWQAALAPIWRDRTGTRGTALLTIAVLIGSHLLVLALIMSAALDGQVNVTQAALYLQGMGGIVNLWFPWHVVTLREATRTLAAIEALPQARDPDRSADAAPPLTGDIAFDSVRFGYPGRPEPVFDGLELTIHAGASLAIVGANGAGKTTLVKLLAGLLDPDAGRVTVGGAGIAMARTVWQSQVAAIFQDYARYPLNARDNIVVGRGSTDPAGIDRALDRAMARDVVAGLPEGLDTQLGREFGGVELSGGQWQRLALARALYAVERGATVLVLDEPTAQLDVRAEAALFDRFLDLTHGLTTVLISHRFSSVRHSDRIVVLDGGRVVEDGSHEQLVAAGGRYAHMFAEQARYFEASDA